MRSLVLALLVSALCGAALAQAPKRAIGHGDVWLMRRLGPPVVSPDGRWIVVSVDEPAYDVKNERRDLWLLSLQGDVAPRRITASNTAQTDVEWSPDSEKIAFSAQREGDETRQIYVLNLKAGGEAERMTHLNAGARLPHWSPEGKRLLFVSEVEDQMGDRVSGSQTVEMARVKTAARFYDNFPVRVENFWREPRHAHLFVQEIAGGAEPHDLLAGTRFAATPNFGAELTPTGENFPATWTPDGRGILFVAGVNVDALAYSELNTDLFLTSSEGGEPTRLTTDPDRYGAPAFSADGNSLVISVVAGGNGYVYNLKRLVRYGWPFDAAARTVLTKNFDRAPEQAVIAPDNSRVYFTAQDAGLEKLYSVPIEGGPVRIDIAASDGMVSQLAAGGRGDDFRLVVLGESAIRPPEVFAWNPQEKGVRQLSRFNADRVTSLDLFPVEHFWTKNPHGLAIHSLIVRPPLFDPAKKYPVVVLIHDGPWEMAADRFDSQWNPHLLAAAGYLVVETNYRGSSGFGEDFARALQGDPLKGPAEDVNAVVDEVLHHFEFTDGDRVAAIGIGYGGHLVNWLQATTTRYRALVAHGASADLDLLWATGNQTYGLEVTNGGPVWEQGALWREQNPVRLAANHAVGSGWVTPILLSTGENDFRIPIANTLENWTYLQRLRVPSHLLIYPDEGHVFEKGNNSRQWEQEVQDWLKRWLQAEK